MLDKKQIRAIFLFEFKISHKAVERTHNINNSFGPGIANEYTVQWWFKKFCRGDKSLEDEEHCGWLSEVDNDRLRTLLKLVLLKHHKRLPKNSASTILWSFGIWGKLERWKKLNKWVPHELTANQKNCQFEVLSFLILHNSSKPFLDQMWRVMKSGFYVTTSSVVGPRRSSKALPKVQLTPEQVMVSFWGSAAALKQYSFMNPSETITSEKHAQQIWDALKTAVPIASFGQQNGLFFSMIMPTPTLHSQYLKSWMNWTTKFCLICHFHLTSRQLTTTSSSISTTFCRENASTTNRRQKMLSKCLLNPEMWIFTL